VVDNDVIAVSDATTAEAVKVFEGLYRDANIALANELATFTDELDVDVREAIDAANTQPFCEIHTPGPGVGGHCIPYYPYFVLNWLHGDAPLVATAREVNDAMPEFVVDAVSEGLAAAHEAEERGDAFAADGGAVEGSTVAVLGLTYRAGVKETRASPGVDICEHLARRGADVVAADPLVEAEGMPAEHVELDELPDRDPDAAVLATAHAEFDTVDWTEFDPMVVVDGHDDLHLSGTDHRVYTVGRGWQ